MADGLKLEYYLESCVYIMYVQLLLELHIYILQLHIYVLDIFLIFSDL